MKEKIRSLNWIYLIFASIIILFITVIFLIRFFSKNVEEVSSEYLDIDLKKNENPINLDDVLRENTSEEIVQEMVIEEIDLEYNTEYRNNNLLPKGRIQVLQEGRDGRKNIVIIKKYKKDELISEELVSENLIKASINRIVEIGTGNGNNNYIPKEGDDVFITSNFLGVRIAPDKDSDKVCTLKKDDKVKIAKISGDYVYILSEEHNGYVPIDCITNINPKKSFDESTITNDSNKNSKGSLLSKLSFDMNVGKPSGFSLEQFKKALENQVNDKNNIFNENAEYFYYAEKQYGINGIFLAAVAIHESAFGTSTISINKKNLFGYGAVDSNPSGGAYAFNTYAEGIDMLARVFVKYYLNPKRYKNL